MLSGSAVTSLPQPLTMPVKSDAPVYIPLSDEERNTGVLSDVHLYDAINGFFKDGVVVLENAIPTKVIDTLNERMKADTDRILAGEIKDIHWKWVLLGSYADVQSRSRSRKCVPGPTDGGR